MRESDQLVRAPWCCPRAPEKLCACSICAGAKAEEAKAAGADIVGFDIGRVHQGRQPELRRADSQPDAMRLVGQLADSRPRGLMPNQKWARCLPMWLRSEKCQGWAGAYRTDKNGIVQCTIGRASFAPEALRETCCVG